MPSKYYKDNWEATNKWLRDNAPDYVLKTLNEALRIVCCTDLSDLDKVIKSLDKLDIID